MAALVQSFPSTTVTMLQPRSNQADRYNQSQLSSHHQHHHSHSSSRSSQKYGSTSATGYRGIPTTGPVPTYAFSSTPQAPMNSARHGSLPSSPILSASAAPQLAPLNLGGLGFSNNTPSKSVPTSPSAATFASVVKSSDDVDRSGATQPQPSRYRNIKRTDTSESNGPKQHISALPSGSGMAAVGQLYSHPSQSSSTPSLSSGSSYRGTNYTKSSTDDMQVGKAQQAQQKEASSRYRRRSFGNIETTGTNNVPGSVTDQPSPHTNTLIQPPRPEHIAQQMARPSSGHRHTGSSDSLSSGRSSRPGSATRTESSNMPQQAPAAQIGHIAKQDMRMSNVSNRHNDTRRTPSGVGNPSPLSRPMSPQAEDEMSTPKARPIVQTPASPAAEHLAALNKKDNNKSKSKLRRAFSFGSAAELRKVTAQANLEKSNAAAANAARANVANKRTSRHEEELDPESARIAAKQEAAGLGENIYSGQGHFFTGSTDNLSISSTASSASIMLRKMGQGMKKGTRSFVGLFRPKSVVGVPAADGPLNPASAAQVSMVTVEAEREKVNVNLDPHAHTGGGTGFPKLERNSIDNKMSLDSGTASTDTRSRRSIVGGERERAEVLAAVKKGILKRNDSNQSSPSLRPHDSRAPELTLPTIPHFNDSPSSSAPSTPKDDKRPDSVKINDHNDDYFGSVSRFTSIDSKTGQPITPSRNISFSPRLQFHDTWPPGEYDRRGEIATCNRLTPMLAQQIKEELNSFKMVSRS